MMRAVVSVLGLGIAGSIAFATGSLANLPIPVRDTLTSIDTVPTLEQINFAYGSGADPLSNLSDLSQDVDVDVGVRVRAIHALAKYCPDPCTRGELAHRSLSALITATKNDTLGEPIVLLRAAIETIGTLAVDSDPEAQGDVADVVTPLLDHPSRDIRAASARALRDLCATQAVIPLRVRYTSEPTEQVKVAISEALRILGQCGM
jgi:hypothetical protein